MIYLSLIVVIFLLIFFLYIFSQYKGKKVNQARKTSFDPKYLDFKWQEIENTFNLKGESHFAKAIIESDKLVDYTLKGKKIPGETFAERLKKARNFFDNSLDYDNLWTAHKVRNEIVHQTGYEITHGEAKRVLELYKKSLGILKVR